MNVDLLMQRCIELARNGYGKVSPNPMVGSLLYKNGRIIGEGYHRKYGGDHGEVDALKNCTEDPDGSIIFVNLEPCSIFGNTPPCADALIKANVNAVYIAMVDPNPKVSGNGICKLINAGIRVYLGCLEAEAKELNKRFICYHERKRPYVFLKWAQSSDGFIGKENEKVWISDEYTARITHQSRAREDAILIGRKTLDLDQPQLTSRKWTGSDPLRIVIDPDFKGEYSDDFLSNALIVSRDQTIENSISYDEEKTAATICSELYKRKIQSLIVEGGSITHQCFIDEGLWDEAMVFVSSHEVTSGVKAANLNDPVSQRIQLRKDTLEVSYNTAL